MNDFYQLGESIGELIRYFAGVLLLLFLVFLVIFIFLVCIIRWVLKINTIIKEHKKTNELLKTLAGNLQALNSPWHKCDSCGLFAPDNFFKEIDSGQKICKRCCEEIKNHSSSSAASK
jgi:hypothetical protein